MSEEVFHLLKATKKFTFFFTKFIHTRNFTGSNLAEELQFMGSFVPFFDGLQNIIKLAFIGITLIEKTQCSVLIAK